MSTEHTHQSTLEQSCSDLERLLETERGRAKELEVCRERLEGRVGELVREVTSVRGEVERETRERAALGEQAKVRGTVLLESCCHASW